MRTNTSTTRTRLAAGLAAAAIAATGTLAAPAADATPEDNWLCYPAQPNPTQVVQSDSLDLQGHKSYCGYGLAPTETLHHNHRPYYNSTFVENISGMQAYHLHGRYTMLGFRTAFLDTKPHSQDDGVVRVIGDNRVLGEFRIINGETRDHSVDVTGVHDLRIDVWGVHPGQPNGEFLDEDKGSAQGLGILAPYLHEVDTP